MKYNTYMITIEIVERCEYHLCLLKSHIGAVVVVIVGFTTTYAIIAYLRRDVLDITLCDKVCR
jgi:hypothetical protein